MVTGFQTRQKLTDKVGSGKASSGYGELKMAKAVYNYGTDGGAIAEITPRDNALIPDNAIIVGGTINSIVAVTSAGGANVRIGLSAGGTNACILGDTAKGSFTLNALINAVPTFAVPVKTTDKGRITITPDAVLTAGVIEIVLYYFVAKA